MFDNDRKLDLNSKTFDVLDLELFKNHRFKTVMCYVFILWGLTILKVVLFASDIYTCIKLLAFNSWSNNVIKPYLSFKISKWLFSGCILASIVLMLWEVINGIRIYRTKSIALTYVNNFSRMVYSIKDYKVFCVYNRITPKGRFQKISFYTFFEFKDCARLLFTDTPRQVINGLTLWSVLITNNNGANLGQLENFNGLITKIKIIADTNHQEAVLLSFMLLSFAIWAFFMAKLAVAIVFAPFVYHTIYSNYSVRGLKQLVCTTVNKRVDELVEKYKWKKDQKSTLEKGLIDGLTVHSFHDLEKNIHLPSDFSSRGTSNTQVLSNYNLIHSSTSDQLTRKFVPVPFTSVINQDADKSTELLLPPRTVFPASQQGPRPKPLSDSSSAIQVNPFRSDPLNETTDSINSTLNENNPESSFNSKRNFVKQLTLENTDSNSEFNDQINDIVDDYDDVASPLLKTNPFGTFQNHVTTPDRVYFQNDTPIPVRTTSIMNRKLRMEAEDYEEYAARFHKSR
ncbi:unnamed protein product [Kluyveromyces dobzhanskii CBS 2104]|uniref:WGS project CCBQ000000000 data, contig 00107 n=1 Tax=Kluyveromyces dobzhanskii CBS 2104 TaxID=1427455 RepID=A0A0A8KZ79_9SACH|nr:unnamed protein product [Kluyveromyces dobzhanskii CBS 2104]